MPHKSDCPAAVKADCSIYFCGDTFLRTRNGENPFALISERIDGRTACINCETSLEGGNRPNKNVSLTSNESAFDYIPHNISIVSIVNNHMADGSDPFEMAAVLKSRGKTVVGPANPARVCTEIGGLSYEFFSAYFRLPRARLSYRGSIAAKLENMICDSDAQHRVVNLHWGYEHTDVPAPFQRELARRLVDAGASLIIGHHPHVPQGWEVYRHAAIFYSLGNFNFWQIDKEIPAEDNKWGYMVRYDPRSGNAESVIYRINDNYQPYAVEGSEQEKLSKRLDDLCSDVRCVNNAIWHTDNYAKWRASELKVWKRRCWEMKSPALTLKFIAWLLLPMQIRYHIHSVAKWISLLFFANSPKKQG